MSLKIKICGMREADNIRQLVALAPDFIGFIFYHKSKRYAEDLLDESILKEIPTTIQKIGVFVNQTFEEVEKLAAKYQLDGLQLHGEESVNFCKALKDNGHQVIKVFSVKDSFDFNLLEPYKPYVDFFLFDTATPEYGGSGKTFDWELLKQYDNEIPLFLSGGLNIDNIEDVQKLEDLNIYALDLNSKFEINPAEKDITLLKKLDFDRVRKLI